MTDEHLSLTDVNSYYGESHILRDVSLSIERDEVVGLLGRNGMGKTTLLNTIMGTVEARSGSIHFEGEDVTGLPVDERSRRGIALVPQERRILPNLTVDENLNVAHRDTDGGRDIEDVYDLFPRLEERCEQLGQSLSGGEQQMLAIGRALVQNPRLLLLDEPFEGLAPKIVDIVVDRVRVIKEDDITVLIVGQKIEETLELADRSYILEDGRIVYEDTASALLNDEEAQQKWLALD